MSEETTRNKLADAFIAIRDHGWELLSPYENGKKFLVPPEDNEMRHWCAEWDEYGLPHWLPNYSKRESKGVTPTKDIPIYEFE